MNHNYESVEQILLALPLTEKTDFFPASRNVANDLASFKDTLNDIIADTSANKEFRIKALYFLLHYLRRQNSYQKYRRLVDDYRKELGSGPLFRTFEVVYERSLGDDVRAMARAIRASRRAIEHYTDSPGVLHQFAELVITDYEINRQTNNQMLQEAEKVAERAISLANSGAAQYWSTIARLQSALHDFRSARRSIAEAIDQEPAEGRDYAVRLSSYQLVETRIQFAEERQRTEQREEEARIEFRTIRSQMLEILGLLAAVIAFLTTSTSIAAGQTFVNAARLLTISASLVIVVFAAFAYAFKISSFLRLLFPVAVGIGAFIAALFIV